MRLRLCSDWKRSRVMSSVLSVLLGSEAAVENGKSDSCQRAFLERSEEILLLQSAEMEMWIMFSESCLYSNSLCTNKACRILSFSFLLFSISFLQNIYVGA